MPGSPGRWRVRRSPPRRAATVLMFGGYTPVTGFGGMERLAVYPLRCWLVIAGIWLLHGQTTRGLIRLPCSRHAQQHS
jgi:hypothetical protein